MGTMQTVNKDSNDFGEIRREGYVYVDKTAWFHRLASAKGEKMFFLVPRASAQVRQVADDLHS